MLVFDGLPFFTDALKLHGGIASSLILLMAEAAYPRADRRTYYTHAHARTRAHTQSGDPSTMEGGEHVHSESNGASAAPNSKDLKEALKIRNLHASRKQAAVASTVVFQRGTSKCQSGTHAH